MPSPLRLSSKKQDWQTPPEIADLIERFNGGQPIGLDPCSAPNNPTKARRFIHDRDGDDGLDAEWSGHGLVYVNPPFDQMTAWVDKLVFSASRGLERGDEFLLMTTASTGCKWFKRLFRNADAIAFWHGSSNPQHPAVLRRTRIAFIDAETGIPMSGNTAYSAVSYFGQSINQFHEAFRDVAHVVLL